MGAVRRGTLIEAVSVTAAASAVTASTGWRAIEGLGTSVPGALGDPTYFAWQLAWVSHAAASGGPLWTTNAFDATPGSLAFTDTILGYAPLGLVARALGATGQSAALIQLNIGGLLATVMAAVGAYALARALGAGWAGSAIAGVAFGFAPWRLAQVIHLNVVSTGGIALALALLARGHGWSMTKGHQAQRAHWGWVIAGWLVACWQLSLSLAIGIPFAYALLVIGAVSVVGWLRAGRPALGAGGQARRVVFADATGCAALLAFAFLVTRPYLRVIDTYPEAARGVDQVRFYSPPLHGLLTAAQADRLWAGLQSPMIDNLSWPGEMALLPGFVLICLAVAGICRSSWRSTWRIALATVVVTVTVLALGTSVAGGRWTYLPVFHYLPGWSSQRTPGRLIIWVTLALSLLAAGFVDKVVRTAQARVRAGIRRRPDPGLVLAACTVLLPTLIVVEGWGSVPYGRVPVQPVPLANLPQPVLVLPTGMIPDYHTMLWGTEGWPRLVNGSSGFDPDFQVKMRMDAEDFPSPKSVQALRRRGVATVVLVPSRAIGTAWALKADAPVPAGISRTVSEDAVVFDLRGRG